MLAVGAVVLASSRVEITRRIGVRRYTITEHEYSCVTVSLEGSPPDVMTALRQELGDEVLARGSPGGPCTLALRKSLGTLPRMLVVNIARRTFDLTTFEVVRVLLHAKKKTWATANMRQQMKSDARLEVPAVLDVAQFLTENLSPGVSVAPPHSRKEVDTAHVGGQHTPQTGYVEPQPLLTHAG